MDNQRIGEILEELSVCHGKLAEQQTALDIKEQIHSARLLLADLTRELAGSEIPIDLLLGDLAGIYGQIYESRALVDIPRLASWAEDVLDMMTRRICEPPVAISGADPAAAASDAEASPAELASPGDGHTDLVDEPPVAAAAGDPEAGNAAAIVAQPTAADIMRRRVRDPLKRFPRW